MKRSVCGSVFHFIPPSYTYRNELHENIIQSLQFTRKSTPGPSKPENIRGGGEEEEEEDRPNSSMSTLPAVLSGQSLNEDGPQEIIAEEVVTGGLNGLAALSGLVGF